MELQVELGRTDRNINLFVEALAGCRRGIWRHSSLPKSALADVEVASLPDLPGYMIAVDQKAATVRIWDPLAKHPDLESILAAWRKVNNNKPIKIEAEEVRRDVPPATIQRWLCELYRHVEAKNAQLRQGEFPKGIAERVRDERNKAAEKVGMEIDEEEGAALAKV